MSEPKPIAKWEVESLRKIEAKWYESYYSIIFIPPKEVPQTKGKWQDSESVVEMIAALKSEYPPETVLLVVSSRCGEISAEDADQWLEMREAMIECAKDEEEYVRNGVCSGCGAKNRKEAEKLCKPSAIGDTGDYGCAGDMLWEGEPEHEEEQP